MEEQDIVNFERRITERREYFIDYSEYLNVTPVARGAMGNLTEYFTAFAKFMLVRLRNII